MLWAVALGCCVGLLLWAVALLAVRSALFFDGAFSWFLSSWDGSRCVLMFSSVLKYFPLHSCSICLLDIDICLYSRHLLIASTFLALLVMSTM